MNSKQEKKAVKKAARKDVKKSVLALAQEKKAQIGSKSGLRYNSPYLLAILDPEGHGMGAKIPDEITVPSMPFTGRMKLQQVSGGAGTGVAFIFALGASNCYYQIGTISAVGAITWGGTWVVAPWNTTLQTNSQMWRVVSAIARIQVQGSANNNQGRIVTAFYPVAGAARSLAFSIPPATVSAVENSAFAMSKNVASGGNAGEIRFIPADVSCTAYVQTNSGTTPGGAAPGYFVVLADGLAAAVNTEVYITENDEIVALSGNASVMTSTPSKSDPIEMAVVSNTLSENPTLSIAQSKAVQTGSPIPEQLNLSVKSGFKEHKPATSMLDNVLAGASSLWETGKKVAPIAASLLALL